MLFRAFWWTIETLAANPNQYEFTGGHAQHFTLSNIIYHNMNICTKCHGNPWWDYSLKNHKYVNLLVAPQEKLEDCESH